MQITVTLPDDFAQHADPRREALEALAIEGYRAGTLSHYQTAQLLGLSRYDLDGFLKARGITERAYDLSALEMDLEAVRDVEVRGLRNH